MQEISRSQCRGPANQARERALVSRATGESCWQKRSNEKRRREAERGKRARERGRRGGVGRKTHAKHHDLTPLIGQLPAHWRLSATPSLPGCYLWPPQPGSQLVRRRLVMCRLCSGQPSGGASCSPPLSAALHTSTRSACIRRACARRDDGNEWASA